jgi:hypothetical protein
VRDEANRAAAEAGEAQEEPVLLDPVVASDCKLLCFDSSNGKPIARFTEEQDAWKNLRANESINYYHLNEGTWNFKRKDLMDEVSVLCENILAADEEEAGGMIDDLLFYLEPHEEFISASEQIIREKGLLERVI